MTTYNPAPSPIAHASDADFRAWGSSHDAALTAIGAVQTADTGQINWVTVLRPGTNTDAGYSMWRFGDALQATAPIFFKVYYGTFASATVPRVRLGVGTGSDGAGNLTGLVIPEQTLTPNSAINSTVTNYQTYACGVAGMIGIAFKVGSQGAAGTVAKTSGFVISRVVDSAGLPTADGFSVIFPGSGTLTSNIPVSYLTNTVYTLNSSGCMLICEPAGSTVGGISQVYKHYMITPRARPLVQVLSVIKTENPQGTQFQAAPVGTTLRNYMPLGTGLSTGTVTNNTACGVAFLWE